MTGHEDDIYPLFDAVDLSDEVPSSAADPDIDVEPHHRPGERFTLRR
ncbi:hypothetical protein GCM10020000_00380 [Streptomyces olivoverticillatus]